MPVPSKNASVLEPVERDPEAKYCASFVARVSSVT
jgi:hypothetical protein